MSTSQATRAWQAEANQSGRPRSTSSTKRYFDSGRWRRKACFSSAELTVMVHTVCWPPWADIAGAQRHINAAAEVENKRLILTNASAPAPWVARGRAQGCAQGCALWVARGCALWALKAASATKASFRRSPQPVRQPPRSHRTNVRSRRCGGSFDPSSHRARRPGNR